jgi:hypothetical protein
MNNLVAIVLVAAMHVPDPTITPGAIRDTDPTVICAPGYAKSHRVWHDKRGTAAKYNVPWSIAQGMEDDDLAPIGLGGDNADPRNHWLQQCSAWRNIGSHGLRECIAGEAWYKDVHHEHPDEALVCRVLRTQGHAAATILLHNLQQYYMTGGWAR